MTREKKLIFNQHGCFNQWTIAPSVEISDIVGFIHVRTMPNEAISDKQFTRSKRNINFVWMMDLVRTPGLLLFTSEQRQFSPHIRNVASMAARNHAQTTIFLRRRSEIACTFR